MTAVVRGAAIFGIEKSANKTTTTMCACPRSYGVLDSTLYSDVNNCSQDRVTDPILNKDMAKNQLRWLIKKGDLVLSNRIKEVSRPFDRMFTEYGSKKGTIPIFAYNYDDLPERYDNSHSGNSANFPRFQYLVMLINCRTRFNPDLYSRV